jgi:hypothetical protein
MENTHIEVSDEKRTAAAYDHEAPSGDLANGARPQVSPQACSTCGDGTLPAKHVTPLARAVPPSPAYVYAIGKIDPLAPKLGVEKEFAQVSKRADTAGLTDRQVLRKVLSDPDNIYLAQQYCWIMSIFGQQAYIIVPTQHWHLHRLLESLRPEPNANSLDAVIGIRSQPAPPDMCNGLTLPMVLPQQIYSFDRGSLLKSIPRPAAGAGKEFDTMAAELAERILGTTDNLGADDAHRALNYLALRDPAVYARAAECLQRDMTLTEITTRPWRLSATRRIVEVDFKFTQRKNEFVETYRTRVDVNEIFPFLASPMTLTIEH